MGPRPLPAHLVSAGATLLSARLALPFLKNASPLLKPLWSNAAFDGRIRALVRALDGVEAGEFAAAVEAELIHRAEALIDGIERYRGHPYVRDLEDPPAIWQEGSTRLLDYGATQELARQGAPVLVVPSLINRGYILDLMAGRSLMRFLASMGLRPFLVDWGRPGSLERGFDLTDYIAGRLDQAFEAILAGIQDSRSKHSPISILGYCMGGLMALALAERRQRETGALVLLATPWDFSGQRAVAALATPVVEACAALGEVPTDALQTLFFAADPLLAIRKFARFAALDPASPAARQFVATEDWLNDGVPLALPTARACFEGWYGENTPFRRAWRIAGRALDPARVVQPTLIVVAKSDRLVPPAASLPLAAALPDARVLEIESGHIALINGTLAPERVWRPVAAHLGAGR